MKTSSGRSSCPGASVSGSRRVSSSTLDCVVSGDKEVYLNEQGEQSRPRTEAFHRNAVFMDYLSSSLCQLGSFLPEIMSSYLEPVWVGVGGGYYPPSNLLPDVCSFPTAMISSTLGASSSSFMLCKNFSSRWTLVDTLSLATPNRPPSVLPESINHFMNALSMNETGFSSTVSIDPSTSQLYLTELEWCNDGIRVSKYDVIRHKFRRVRELANFPIGATNIAGVYDNKLLACIAGSIHVFDLINASESWTVTDAITQGVSSASVPVSVQVVAPFITSAFEVLYLNGGHLMAANLDNNKQRQILLKNENITYISITVEPATSVAVLVGYKNRTQYITLFDLIGLFEISTTPVPAIHPYLAVVSVAVVPGSLNVVIVGRSKSPSAGSNLGAVAYVLPPVFD